jgi:hypothetical protein
LNNTARHLPYLTQHGTGGLCLGDPLARPRTLGREATVPHLGEIENQVKIVVQKMTLNEKEL